jgi:hypothetical protein
LVSFWQGLGMAQKQNKKVSNLAHSDKEKTKKGQRTGFAPGEVCYGYL